MTALRKLLALRWTEYERGWGPRPDGFTVYRDAATMRDHISAFFAERPPTARAPDEYSNPDELQYAVEVEVSDALWDAVQEKGWVWGHYSSNNFDHAKTWEPRRG